MHDADQQQQLLDINIDSGDTSSESAEYRFAN